MAQQVNIKKMGQSLDSARIYKWDVNVQFGDLEGDGYNTINMRCVSTDQPNPTHVVIDVNIRGFTKKETGAVDWNPITLTIIEVHDYALLGRIYALANGQHFNYGDGTQSPKSDYSPHSMTGIQIMLNKLDDVTAKNWYLYGCILETYTWPNMTADKGGAVEASFVVHYDYAELA